MGEVTHEQVNLMLRLYDIRREPRLREARDWYIRNFRPTSLEDVYIVNGGCFDGPDLPWFGEREWESPIMADLNDDSVGPRNRRGDRSSRWFPRHYR